MSNPEWSSASAASVMFHSHISDIFEENVSKVVRHEDDVLSDSSLTGTLDDDNEVYDMTLYTARFNCDNALLVIDGSKCHLQYEITGFGVRDVNTNDMMDDDRVEAIRGWLDGTEWKPAPIDPGITILPANWHRQY